MNAINNVVARRNLYRNGRRVIDAHLVRENGQWAINVIDLHTMKPIKWECGAGNTHDGYNQEVTL